MNIRARPAAAIIRPHSADFLEYEARVEAAAEIAAATAVAAASMIKPDPIRAPRPKSSLDINRTPDSFYYSEENYAEKMRKSALYLQNPQAPQPQQAGNYRTQMGSTDLLLSPNASGLNTIGYENPYERAHKRNELLQDALGGNQTGHTSIPRMSRSQTMGNGAQIRSSSTHPHTSYSNSNSNAQSPQSPPLPLQLQQSTSSLLSSGLTTQQIIQQNEQFLRSASARLPKRSSTFDDDLPINSPSTGTTSPTTTASAAAAAGSTSGLTAAGAANSVSAITNHLEGERKREESMKRLLEWKQRMLQSPLTRKSAQQSGTSAAALTKSGQKSNMSAMAKLGSNPNILLSSTTVSSGAHYGQSGSSSSSNTKGNKASSLDIKRRHSESHANTGSGSGIMASLSGYNSYSSDDEGMYAAKALLNNKLVVTIFLFFNKNKKSFCFVLPLFPYTLPILFFFCLSLSLYFLFVSS